jgi:hypothetical protein
LTAIKDMGGQIHPTDNHPVNEIEEPGPPTSIAAIPEVIATSSPEAEKTTSKVAAKLSSYKIVAGKVQKVLTPSKIHVDTTNSSGGSTPLASPARSISSYNSGDNRHPENIPEHHHPEHPHPSYQRRWDRTQSYDSMISRVRSTILAATGSTIPTPDAAKKFVECGDMADKRAVGYLNRWAGGSQYQNSPPLVFGPVSKHTQEGPLAKASRFGYGTTTPINHPSIREEEFDPFDKESEKMLKQKKEKNPPLLSSIGTTALKFLLHKTPNCFCGKRCARFDGVVPVYVCGTFTRVYLSFRD